MTYNPKKQKNLPGSHRQEQFQTEEEVYDYFSEEKIQCLICGKRFRQITASHLSFCHDITVDEYKERFGLPWSRELTGTLSKLEEQPDFARMIMEIHHRMPYSMQIKCRNLSPQFRKDCERLRDRGMTRKEISEALGVSKKTVVRIVPDARHEKRGKWDRKDFEKIPARMREEKRVMRDVVKDSDLPTYTAWNKYAKKHPGIAQQVREIHHTMPYSVQIAIYDVSPKFFKDCELMRSRGITQKKIAIALGVQVTSVMRAVPESERKVIEKTTMRDFEAMLERMWTQQRNLTDVCKDPDLPSMNAWRYFKMKHSELIERVRRINRGLPYSLQVRSLDVSPQFRVDCERLQAAGMTRKEISIALGVSTPTVKWDLEKSRIEQLLSRREPPDGWRRKDYEAILTRMRKQQRILREVCVDSDLPDYWLWAAFLKKNPEFAEKLRETYYRLPYSRQLNSGYTSPQFLIDCKRLRARGLGNKAISKALGVSSDTVRRYRKKADDE